MNRSVRSANGRIVALLRHRPELLSASVGYGDAALGEVGHVTAQATIHNQHGQLVLDDEHTHPLKTAQQNTLQATS